jgi:hypothetical protein
MEPNEEFTEDGIRYRRTPKKADGFGYEVRGCDLMCLECGVPVWDKKIHARFHSILGGHGHAVAVLTVAHIASHVHDKYEAYDKIMARRHDSWSADAFEEVRKESL